jgi:hypothetical protein
VSSYCASVGLGNPAVGNAVVPAGLDGADGLPAGMVAVRVADVAAAVDGGGGSALVVAGGGPVRSGELLAFCHPVVVASAVVGRDGRVLAGGWLPDHVRLGLLESELGQGVIEAVVAADDRVDPPQRLRIMSAGLTARLVIAMTLMPGVSAREVLARLVGLVAKVPFARAWRVPGSKVITAWRRRVGAGVMQALFWRVAGPLSPVGEAAGLLGDLLVCAVDGFQTRLADTPVNRERFGSSGTSEGGGSFPQLRAVLATVWTGRAVLGAAMDGSGVGEQTLLRRLVADHPDLFCPGRVFLVDRNFLGYELISDIVAGGAQLVMRVKAGITLHHVRWLPDGSQLVYLTAPDRCSVLMLRAVEYTVATPDGVSELFCLATTLLDHHAYPAAAIRDAYPKRWAAAETTIGENKSTITDAGPSRGPILRSTEPALVEQEFWAWLTGCQLTRKAAATAAAASAANPRPAAASPPDTTTTQRDARVSTGQVSFTGVRNEATRSMTQTLVTATTSTAALTAHARAAADMILATLVTTGRQRSSERKRKHQPRFPHTSVTKTTRTGHGNITMFHPHTTGTPTPQPPDTS